MIEIRSSRSNVLCKKRCSEKFWKILSKTPVTNSRDFSTVVFRWILRNFQEHLFWIIPVNGYFCEIKQWENKFTQIFLQNNLNDIVPRGAVVGTRTYSFTYKGLHHRCFLMKFVKFYGTSFLQNTIGRLLLISSNIFDVSLALSVILQFSRNLLSWNCRNTLFMQVIHSVYSENI